MTRTLGLAAGMLLLSGSASAQTTLDQTRATAKVQAQIDNLVSQLAPQSRLFGSTDVVVRSGRFMVVAGWVLNCDDGTADTVELELDGVIRPEAFSLKQRFARPDVELWAMQAGVCVAPAFTGVAMVLDVWNYDLEGTLIGRHDWALRVRNKAGVSKRLNVLHTFR